MHAAENNVTASGFGGLIRKLEGIAAKVGEFNDFVSLVVVSQNYDVASQTYFRRGDSLVERVVRRCV